MNEDFKGTAAFVGYKGKLYFFYRSAEAPVSPNTWGLLGGQREDGEIPKQTLLRELYEEANIRPHHIEFLDKTAWGSCLFLVKLTDEEFQNLEPHAEDGQDEKPKVEGFSWNELSKVSLAQHIDRYLIKYRQQIQLLLKD